MGRKTSQIETEFLVKYKPDQKVTSKSLLMTPTFVHASKRTFSHFMWDHNYKIIPGQQYSALKSTNIVPAYIPADS